MLCRNDVETIDIKTVVQAQTERAVSNHLVSSMRHRRQFAWRERSLPAGPRLTKSGSVERSEIERGPSLLGTAKSAAHRFKREIRTLKAFQT
jgi:hypothetical protein